MMRINEVVHALRLLHIDLICEMPIKKGILHIKLEKPQLVTEGNTKNSTNGDRIYDGIESLVKSMAGGW